MGRTLAEPKRNAGSKWRKVDLPRDLRALHPAVTRHFTPVALCSGRPSATLPRMSLHRDTCQRCRRLIVIVLCYTGHV